jgi:hypothetical protein
VVGHEWGLSLNLTWISSSPSRQSIERFVVNNLMCIGVLSGPNYRLSNIDMNQLFGCGCWWKDLSLWLASIFCLPILVSVFPLSGRMPLTISNPAYSSISRLLMRPELRGNTSRRSQLVRCWLSTARCFGDRGGGV